MPMICVVIGCTNRSNRETTKSFYRVPKVVAHRGETWKKLTEKRREKWLENLYLRSSGAESANARVCSDHFVKGCPSALNEVESVDWAPTVKLGHQKRKPKSKALRKRTERIKVKEEAAEVLLDLHESPENPEQKIKLEMLHYQQGAECQTDLTMDDIKRMEDVCKQTQSFQKNEDLTKLHTGLPKFFVLVPVFNATV
ncbi:hypothetical protein ABG768_005886 [Culter alburnus]|uniref:THAP-type domain-containing protein n=1 Tax=Culter alburnus TaxID=194366 RepID=A0AAW1ZT99_CULAL